MNDFGIMLRAKRHARGFSQRQLAGRVGVDSSYISKLENGHLRPASAKRIVLLAEVLECAPEELLASAKKLPVQVVESLGNQPMVLRFLQEAFRLRLSPEEWEQMLGHLCSLRSHVPQNINDKDRTQSEKMARAEELASLGTLSVSLTHEITQALTVIRLVIENSLAELEEAPCPRSVTEALNSGLTAISNLVSIINRLRNFARRTSERTVKKIDLKIVAERIVNLLNKRAQLARVTLRLKGIDKLPPIYSCDRDLEQMFFALLDNAIQAADGQRSGLVTISGAVKEDGIELQFSDNCGGIAPENLDKIFEPFFTTKPAGEGTGLGLCIVQRIVSQAGGKVRVKSVSGEGSTFFVTLPFNNDREVHILESR